MATAVATQEPREITVVDLPKLIASSKDARASILPFLPEGVSLERVAASLRLAIARDKDGNLKKCNPMSVFMAVAKVQQWGLEIGETAHLVPFGAECVPVADYKGLAELVISAGVARHVESHIVYEKETFRVRRGSAPDIYHELIADPKQRGRMLGAYALFHLRGGVHVVEYMTVEEIDAIRQQYSKQWKKGALPEWYARKTVVRRGVKLLPKNPRLLERLAALDNEVVEVPEALARMAVTPIGDGEDAPVVHRIGAGDAPPPLTTQDGAPPYDAGAAVNSAPIPPAQHSDDPGFNDDDRFDE